MFMLSFIVFFLRPRLRFSTSVMGELRIEGEKLKGDSYPPKNNILFPNHVFYEYSGISLILLIEWWILSNLSQYKQSRS